MLWFNSDLQLRFGKAERSNPFFLNVSSETYWLKKMRKQFVFSLELDKIHFHLKRLPVLASVAN